MTTALSLLVTLAVTLVISATARPESLATTLYGVVAGVQELSRNATPYLAFRKIPYAKPPVGQRRFTRPEPADPWNGVLDASEDAPLCIQTVLFSDKPFQDYLGQEDCLYLSVFSPNLEARLPVMVFIHGGGYMSWTGAKMFGPEYFMDYPMVVVTMNYRLGPFGFLSLGEETLPSNLGLWDQLQALRWVSKNIANFGGDPSRVTLFGQSAGASSVHLHLKSRKSEGLYQQAIMHSGNLYNPFTLVAPGLAKRRGQKALSLLGCRHQSVNEDALECLKQASHENIVRLQGSYVEWDTDPAVVFGPVVGKGSKAFFTEKDLRKNSSIPLLIGDVIHEGAIKVAAMMTRPDNLFSELDTNFTGIAPVTFTYGQAEQYPDVSKRIKDFYFGGNPIQPGMNITNAYGDAWFYSAREETIEKHTGPVYRFMVETKPLISFVDLIKAPFPPGVVGASHTDDMFYLFNMTRTIPVDALGPDLFPLSNRMVQLWAHFIISGQPTEDDSWPASREEEMVFTKDKYFLRSTHQDERTNLWKSVKLQLKLQRDQSQNDIFRNRL